MRIDGAPLDVIQASKPEPRIMRCEFSDYEWSRHQADAAEQVVRRASVRRVRDGIVWVLRSGAPWRDLPATYGPRTTCYNRFVRWMMFLSR